MHKKLGMVGIVALAIMAFSSSTAFAIPDYLDLYLNDYYATNGSQNCGLCHQNPNGGGARNPFGLEFEKLHVITAMMRVQNPEKFKYPISKVSDTLTVHFADPYGQQIVIDSGGKKITLDAVRQTVDGKQVTP